MPFSKAPRINHVSLSTWCNWPVVAGLLCSSQEGIVERLFKWAQEAEQPLRIYATGLLAGAMENQDIAANYREENSVLVSKGPLQQSVFSDTHYSTVAAYLLQEVTLLSL